METWTAAADASAARVSARGVGVIWSLCVEAAAEAAVEMQPAQAPRLFYSQVMEKLQKAS
jgi:hypothetical protein